MTGSRSAKTSHQIALAIERRRTLPAELLAKPYLDFMHPADRDSTLAEAQNFTGGVDTIEGIAQRAERCAAGPIPSP